jgi:hypothetical protein
MAAPLQAGNRLDARTEQASSSRRSASAAALPPIEPAQMAPAQQERKRRAVQKSKTTSDMSPEQLYKKRAHDREAQRLVRERNKSHVEMLEKKIVGLEGGEPVKALRKVEDERDNALRECEALRKKLALVSSIVSDIQPLPEYLTNQQGRCNQC